MYKADHPEVITTENNHFNLYSKVKGLSNFLDSIHSKEVLNHNNLIALYGEWGCGKSSVVKTVNKDLNGDKFNSFIFEAWKYEKDDNLPFSIFEALLDNLVGNKEAIKLILKEGFFEGLKSFKNGITIKTNLLDISPKDMATEKAEESLYTKIENFIDKFQESLDEYSNGKTTVVFIDDLDRCEDESIINLLIGLKLMFSFENIIFVCCIDKVATVEALKRKYHGNQEKAESFLDKLFLFDFNLIPVEGNDYINQLEVVRPIILSHVLTSFDIKNPRRIKKIVNKIIMTNEFIDTSSLKQIEKELFYMILYYLYSLKEINFRDFNRFLSITCKELKLSKTNVRVYGSSRFTYHPSIEFFQNETEEVNKLRELYTKIIYTFGDMYTMEEIQGHEYINGNVFNQAVELVKKYS